MPIVQDRAAKSVKLVQQQYAAAVVHGFGFRFGLSDSKPAAVPSKASVNLARCGDKPLDLRVHPYRELFGSLP
jgi:hypothetical protein